MNDWHCRIGKISPRLGLVRDPKVYEPDYADEVGFVGDLISAVRHVGVRGYTVVVTHDDGSIHCGSKVVRPGSDFQMVGAMAYELVRMMQRFQEGNR